MDRHAMEAFCGDFRRRLKARLLQAGLCRLAIVLLALPPLFMLFDWWLHLPTLWRLGALLGSAGAAAATAWWTMLAPMRRPWSVAEILAYCDDIHPGERGMLHELHELQQGTGIQEAESAQGRAMVEEAAASLAPLVGEARRVELFERRRLGRWRQVAALVGVAVIAVALALPGYFATGCQRFFNPFTTQRWPSRTVITLQPPPSGWSVPQMESFAVRGRVTGVVPPHVTLAYETKSAGYWIREKIAVREGGVVQYTFPQVRESIRFRISGGDFVTDTYRIETVDRPYLRKIVAHYDYPDYAGMPNRVAEGGQLIGLEGTAVRLVCDSSMDLNKAVFVFEDKNGRTNTDMKATGARTFEHRLVLANDGGYTIELHGKTGFRESRPERFEIRVTPDNPPEVELLSPGQDLVATRQATVNVALRARDDFGLRKVSFLYQIDEGQPTSLVDRVTGPLETKGKTKDARFRWDLAKMGLPKRATLRFFVRAQDVNPTGRGVSETPPRQIRLLKPSEFHFEIFEQAKRIEFEARAAWESQYAAWELGAAWPGKALDKEEDPVWQEMQERQELSMRACKAMESYLRDLTQQYEQNDMRREFMAGRLNALADLLHRVTEKEHPAIDAGLQRARPRTEADATRIKALRASALAAFADNQKLATLYLERLLRRLFDWRDLQTAFIRTTMLQEEQEEVLAQTTTLGPTTLGWKIQDLEDTVQDRLLTLGKRQGTLFDVESELEKELEFQMYRAEKQRRKSVLLPLATAYRGLRDSRVNDNLRQAAKSIGENQLLPIIKNQKAALDALTLVKGGLAYAGQNIDPEDTSVMLTVAMNPAKIVDVQPKEETAAAGATEEAATVVALPADDLRRALAVGSDPLTAAITATWEAQDLVRSRTVYYAANSGPGEMPRYLSRKIGIMLEKQVDALAAARRAVDAAEKNNAAPVRDVLTGVSAELDQTRDLLTARYTSPTVQQMQSDSMETLDDLRRLYLPLEKAVKELADENRSRNGMDAFDRAYVVRSNDLERTVSLAASLNQALVLQRDVQRKLARLSGKAADVPAVAEAEKANRVRAVAAQVRATALLVGAKPKDGAFSEIVAPRVRGAGLDGLLALDLGPAAEAIRAGSQDAALGPSLRDAAGLLEQALDGLKSLLDERVRPPAAVAATAVEAPQMTKAEWDRMRTPEYLRDRIGKDTSLPAEVRETMLRALGKEFPQKYRDLLADYYASFLQGERQETKPK